MSTRKILIVIIIVIGIAFLAPSNPYTDPVTQPIIKTVKEINSYFRNELGVSLPATETKVYKWQDEDGKWHFSNTEPPRNVDSQSKTYKSDDNVVPFPKADD